MYIFPLQGLRRSKLSESDFFKNFMLTLFFSESGFMTYKLRKYKIHKDNEFGRT